MNKKLFLLGVLSLSVVFNANATENIKNHQPEIDGYRVKFKTIDKDGKGYISEKQYIKYHNQNWKLIDKMEEGYVNKDEFTHGQNGKVHHKEKAFLEMDFNKDGKLTKKEFHLKKKLEFAQMDKDSNGKISEYEYFDANKMEEKYKMKEKTPQGTIKEKYKYKVNK